MDVSKVVPPLFELGKSPLYVVASWNLVCFVKQVENVVVQLSTGIDVIGELLTKVFRWIKSILVVVMHYLLVCVGV